VRCRLASGNATAAKGFLPATISAMVGGTGTAGLASPAGNGGRHHRRLGVTHVVPLGRRLVPSDCTGGGCTRPSETGGQFQLARSLSSLNAATTGSTTAPTPSLSG
jgi:hypothetical protein